MRPMTEIHPLRQAIELVGLGPLAKGLGLTYPALRKWERAGRLPRTEWTGETNYAGQIAVLTDNRVTKAQLLAKWPDLAHPSTSRPPAAITSDAAQA